MARESLEVDVEAVKGMIIDFMLTATQASRLSAAIGLAGSDSMQTESEPCPAGELSQAPQ